MKIVWGQGFISMNECIVVYKGKNKTQMKLLQILYILLDLTLQIFLVKLKLKRSETWGRTNNGNNKRIVLGKSSYS